MNKPNIIKFPWIVNLNEQKLRSFIKDLVYDQNEDRDSCELHITTKGKTTHAILKKDGKVVKRSTANCHPEDDFDFEIGSAIAIARLFKSKDGSQYVVQVNGHNII